MARIFTIKVYICNLFLLFIYRTSGFNWNPIKSFQSKILSASTMKAGLYWKANLPSWDALTDIATNTPTGKFMSEQLELRSRGLGLPHTDASIRLFDESNLNEEPRVLFFRDTAAWCPYCQKVWMLLEEKRIPYKVQKINMRSYGDKPAEYLRLVPNGLLPAIVIDGKLQTESVDIMMNLDATFTGQKHASMWPRDDSPHASRARSLMRLERDLFGRWCDLVFRPSMGSNSQKRFEEGLNLVNAELSVTPGPWFLDNVSIIDLQYLSHIERMCASVAFWSGVKVRGSGRWPAIDRWFDAFEERPSYLATKSDYYTHVCDIPPQYGPGYNGPEWSQTFQRMILGRDNYWKLPLPPFSPDDVEPVSPAIDPGEEAARHEAAYKLVKNHENIVKFALRGAGEPGKKRFQAPLADPYASPAMEYYEDMEVALRQITLALIHGHRETQLLTPEPSSAAEKKDLTVCLEYLRDRIGVPRDMSYPAARQLRAHINWMIDSNL